MTNPKTLQYLANTFKELSQSSVELKKKIEESKTQLKKDYYNKKLKKNNLKALDILMLLNAGNPIESSKDEKNE